ncbi:MAG: transcription termination/antitermination protein NusG [Bacteroidota bacterium]
MAFSHKKSNRVMAKEWYVIRAISGKEKKVKEYLESEIIRTGMEAYVEQVLIPTEKVFEMRNGKKKLRERNFLPGYILMECEMVAELIPVVKDIPNVIGFLSDKKGSDPVPLRQSEVNRILGKVDEMNEKGEMPEEPFIKGEPVKVMAGPFNGFTGIIDEVYEDKKKLKVVVKIFGRNTPLELNYFQVEKEY